MQKRDYDLRLFSNVLYPTQTFEINLTNLALDWRRSIRAVGGYWLGTFTVRGDADLLQEYFDRWLAMHVQERSAGATTWEGMVYEMDLTIGGVKRRRSLDLMYNAVKSTYVKIDWTGDLLSNGDFESVTGDNFDGWEEGALGAGGVQDEQVVVHGGSHACKVSYDGNGGDEDGHWFPDTSWIRQNVNCVSGDLYRLKFYAAGDAWFAVRNPNAPTNWVIAPTPVSTAGAASYGTQRVRVFPGPAGSEFLVFFFANPHSAAAAGYFDDAVVEERGEVMAETDWATGGAYGLPSLARAERYGRREEILYLDDYPLESADAMRQAFLAEHQWPWARPVSAGQPGDALLEVTCAGYCHTANWQFVFEGDGTDQYVSHWISAIVGSNFGLTAEHGGQDVAVSTAGDCQFLKAGNITENTLEVVEQNTIHQRAWDTITELIELGIAGDTDAGEPEYMPTRAWVGQGRLLHYAKVDRTPRYFLRPDGLYDRLGARATVSPWTIMPSVFRDMSYPVRRDLEGSFLEDARDFWVEEVEVDSSGGILLKTSLFSEQDALESRFRYLGVGEPVDEWAPTPPSYSID